MSWAQTNAANGNRDRPAAAPTNVCIRKRYWPAVGMARSPRPIGGLALWMELWLALPLALPSVLPLALLLMAEGAPTALPLALPLASPVFPVGEERGSWYRVATAKRRAPERYASPEPALAPGLRSPLAPRADPVH